MAAKQSTRRRQPLVLTAEIARQWRDRQDDESLGTLDPLDDYTHIDYPAAKILGQCDGWRDLNLSGLTAITPTVARALAKYPGKLVLNGIRKVDAAVARILAERGNEITLLEGLEELTDRGLAKMLAAFGEQIDDVCLRRLRNLSPEAAKVLSRAECRLVFGHYAKFSERVMGLLSRSAGEVYFCGRKHLQLKHVFGLGTGGKSHDGELVFYDVTQLDTDAAAEVAKYPGAAIKFLSLEAISPEAAAALAPYPGELHIQNVLEHTPEAAVILAKRSGSTRTSYTHMTEASDGSLIVRLNDASVFNLGVVRKLTPELAATLAEAPILDLRNLKTLTPQAALVLAKNHHGTLLLDGLESLSDKVAAALSWHDGGLSLRRVQRLSPKAAEHLGTIRGFLSLGGLKTLTPRLATVLAGFPGSLMLDGVEELRPGVARRLQKHTGLLSMNGLTEISLETAKILAEKPNQKRMVRCGGSVAALQYLLRKDPERVTLMFQLNSNGAFE